VTTNHANSCSNTRSTQHPPRHQTWRLRTTPTPSGPVDENRPLRPDSSPAPPLSSHDSCDAHGCLHGSVGGRELTALTAPSPLTAVPQLLVHETLHHLPLGGAEGVQALVAREPTHQVGDLARDRVGVGRRWGGGRGLDGRARVPRVAVPALPRPRGPAASWASAGRTTPAPAGTGSRPTARRGRGPAPPPTPRSPCGRAADSRSRAATRRGTTARWRRPRPAG